MTSSVKKGEHSDPFLMRGFDKKVVHFKADSDQVPALDRAPIFTIEVDFMGNGTWVP